MKKGLVIIMFLFFIGFSAKVYAETNSNNDVNITKSENINSELNEAQAYKLLYENQKESNQKILSTIYWALGIMLTTSIALIGGNIFNNYRLNNDKINKIALEFDGKFEELKKESISEIQEELKKSTELMNNKSKNILNECNNKINKNMNDQDIKIRKIEGEIIRKIVKSEIEINELAAKYWEGKRVYPNSLIQYIWKAEKELELQFDLAFTLESIIDSLEKSNSIPTLSVAQLEELLKKIPEKYDTHKEKIKIIQRNLPIS